MRGQQAAVHTKIETTQTICGVNGSHARAFFQGRVLKDVLLFLSRPMWDRITEPVGVQPHLTLRGMGGGFSASLSPTQRPLRSAMCKYTHSHALTLVTSSKV